METEPVKATRLLPVRAARLLPVLAWLILAVFMGTRVNRFWIPHDEGLLGQTAVRVLDGQVPHRDFIATYTGGLALLHAGSMALFGEDLRALRITLFAFYLVWLWGTYVVARRCTSPMGAAGWMLLCGLASVPQYPSPLPTWYNLFFTVGTVAALLGGFRSSRRAYLVAAGVCTGLSVAIKIVGLYTAAAVLLSMVWVALNEAEAGATDPGRRVPAWGLRYSVIPALLVFVALVWVAGGGRGSASDLFYFVLPPAAVALVLAWRVWSANGTEATATFWRAYLRTGGPYVLGLAAVVGAGAAAFAVAGGLPQALNGLFVLPFRRLLFASTPMPPLVPSIGLTLLWMGVLAGARARPRVQVAALSLVYAGAVGVLALRGQRALADLTMATVRPAFPALVLWGVGMAFRGELKGEQGTVVWALTAMAAMNGLIQYPFASPGYFFYIAPLLVLGVGAALRVAGASWRPLPVGLAILYGAWLFFNSQNLVHESMEPLALARGGLRVPPADARRYERLVAVVDSLSNSDYILALPDVPEVYFLAAKKNPTRSLFDFFEDPDSLLAEARNAVQEKGVDVAVIADGNSFSGAVPAPLRDMLVRTFPESRSIPGFTVRYRQR